MMGRGYYLTHPEVEIDPDVAVPDWGLSDVGRQRITALSASSWLQSITKIVSSIEAKAVQTATLLAATSGAVIQLHPRMHENDRSATGFLAPDEFEIVADQFFAEPERSERGWERAVDAQARIVGEVEACLETHAGGDLLFAGHGGVGTLLYCHLAEIGISREHDQKRAGSVFAFDLATRRPFSHWLPLESLMEPDTASP